jgi:hypothetical protein
MIGNGRNIRRKIRFGDQRGRVAERSPRRDRRSLAREAGGEGSPASDAVSRGAESIERSGPVE